MTRSWEERQWPYLLALAVGPVMVIAARWRLGPEPKASWAVPLFLAAIGVLSAFAVALTLSGTATALASRSWNPHSLRIAVLQLVVGAVLQLAFGLPAYSSFPQWLGFPWLAGAVVVLAVSAGVRVWPRLRRAVRGHPHPLAR